MHRDVIICVSLYRQRGCPLLANGRFLLLLHASRTVCHYTSLQHHLFRLSEEEAEAVLFLPQMTFVYTEQLWPLIIASAACVCVCVCVCVFIHFANTQCQTLSKSQTNKQTETNGQTPGIECGAL